MSEEQLKQYRARLREASAAIAGLRGKLAEEQGRREPLAIVGMGCRFPRADAPEAFWSALIRGVDGVREIPGERWPRDAIPGGRSEVRWAGLLDAVDGFDAGFFGISPREAERCDPQQRLLLEVSWEALEDAGLPVTGLAGAQVGVFAGLGSLDHQQRLMRRGMADVDAYTATGNLLSTASGRISYSFGFEGPCVSLDTACSSSLVAVALACQSLRAGECEVALAGGVTLLLSPYMMALVAGTQALAPDGRCKVLDARANGFVRGEGCGMVVLKRLADARRDGDVVRAVIRGWAINQDGRSTGLTAPNVRSQAALLRTALARAEVAAHEVGYVEMHGTGTPLGDPIETEALREVFPARADGSRCVLGAVKSNVGHLEAAAGVAGLIKTVLALEHAEIPRNLHFRRLNPRISLAGSALAVADAAVPWGRSLRRRVAGVSAFGISGTNVHVVVEEGDAPALSGDVDEGPALVVLSARSEGALAAGAGRLRGRAAEVSLADLAVSLATTRSPLEQRMAFVASRAGLDAALAAAERGELPVGATRATAGRGRLALLFTGQGAQALGMGQGLHAAWPAFRAAFDECVGLLDAALPRPLRSVMWATPGGDEAGLLGETMYTQAGLFALEVGLAALWRSWGVVPDVVAGHSVGEVAAAHVAGVLSLADAVRLVAARGRLMQALAGGGAMASIEASEEEVAGATSGLATRVAIAAVNGPRQVVVSGDADAVADICAGFVGRGVKVRALAVSHAFHSPRMEPMLAEFGRAIAGLTWQAPARPLVSGLTGRLAGAEVATADYWVRQAREAVRFADVVATLHATGVRTFVEAGPRPTLLAAVGACLADAEVVVLVPSLRAGQDERASALAAVGAVWAHGGAVRWAGVFTAGRRVRLPTYAWQRERHWLDAPDEARAGEATGHPLLGVKLAAAGVAGLFEASVGLASHAWLGDHRVAGRAVVPAAALAELMRAALAGAQAEPTRAGGQVRGLVFLAPLVVPDEGALRVQAVVTDDEGGTVTVYSQPHGAPGGAGWTKHATARAGGATAEPDVLDLAAVRSRCAAEALPAAMYGRFAGLGIAYGPGFRGVRTLRIGVGEALAEVATELRGGFGVAPPLLDAGLQAVLAADERDEGLRLPFAIEAFTVHRAGATSAWAHVRLREGGAADVVLVDADGGVIAEVAGLRLQAADPAALRRGSAAGVMLRRAWQATPPTDARAPALRWVVVGTSTLARGLAGRLGGVATDVAGLAAALAGSRAGVIQVGDADADTPAAALRGAEDGLRAVQAVIAAGTAARVVWVTRGAVKVAADDRVVVAEAPAWGLARTAMLEHPELAGVLIDVGADVAGAADEEAIAAVVRELGAQDGEVQVAWRRGERFVARMERVTAEADAGASATTGSWAPRGTVLVTGGLGALGLHAARWLAERGAPHLILVGRRGLATPGAAEAVAELVATGTRVTVEAVDVADREAVAAMLGRIPEALPLRGVLHAAGGIEDAVLTGQTAAGVGRVFAAKVLGALHLDELTAAMELDFFVLFSSLAGLLGSAGQANYAAANCCLDALAERRRGSGLAAQSLAWGAWADGLAAGLQGRLGRVGMGVLAPAQGVVLLAEAMTRTDALLAVGATAPRVVPGARAPSERWSERLAGLAPGRRLGVVRAAVQEEVGRVLGASEPLATSRPLQELGLDSLMAVELRGALARRFAADLPATLAFDHPTIAALAEWLLTRVLAAAPAAPEVVAHVAAEVPIAIVGMGCRLPGEVDDPEALWRLLADGREGICDVPRERWDADAIYDPDPESVGTATARRGGFLRGIERFDAGFFGISPREAVRMDPQQRLLLETGWEALGHAGIAPDSLMGSDAGVFVGLMYQEYGARVDDLAALDGYVSTGGAASVASGRLAYVLGLKGPCMTVDTACSSSLVTVHLACQALRRGECSLALAGGAAIMLTPTVFVEFSRLRGLAADGRCKSFSAAADGVGWSEGVGMLVLKRLPDAVRDGDTVLAVIRGSAVNQDGRSSGLTAPNGPSQAAVIRRALAQAGLTAHDLDYVECHGTGTALGDPIEARALGEVAAGRTGRPLWIGSVKSNLGHTQAAAGAAGIFKVVLALMHSRIPRSLHFDEPSPHIAWAELPIAVAAEDVAWPRGARPRRAGVSSFGVSGTNAHVVIEEAPVAVRGVPVERSAELFVVSARDDAALAEAAGKLRARLLGEDPPALADVALSLARGRSAMERRLAVVAGSRAELADALAAASAGSLPGGAARGRVTETRPRVVFVFPGQGGQWVGMGRQLLAEEPAFRASLEASDRAIAAEVGWSVLAELAASPEQSQLDRIEVVQPVLFAVEVGLAALWRSWGIEPDVVVGHSMGEVAAAHVAGALTLADAAAVICRRSRLLRDIAGRGAMAVVELDPQAAAAALHGFGERLAVAACNGPRSTVIAGEPAALAELLARLTEQQVFCRAIKVDVASHSPQVEPLGPALRAALAGLTPVAARVVMRSTVTEAEIAGEALTADYWLANVRRPVRFAGAIAGLIDEGHAVFVELSPHPVLTPAVAELLRAAGKPGLAVGSQRREQDERRGLLESLAALWVHGCAPAWERVLPAGARRVALPAYAWQRSRYWVDAPGERRGGHPLLGTGLALSTTPGVRVWEASVGGGRPRWLDDHQVAGVTLVPAAGFVEMALAAGTAALGGEVEVVEVTFVAALPVAQSVQVQLVATAEAGGSRFQIASRAGEDAWTVHARGLVRRRAAEATDAAAVDVAGLRETLGPEVAADVVYAGFAARGLVYGPAFRGITALWRGEGEALAQVRLHDPGDAGRCGIHPALLDACFQVAGAAFTDDATWLPVGLGSLRLVRRPAGALWCHARLGEPAGARRSADLTVVDAAGRLVLVARGLVVQRVAQRRSQADEWFIAPVWERVALPERAAAAGRAVILGDGDGLGGQLAAALVAAGHAVVHAVAGGRWPVDDGDPASLRALLGDAFGGAAPTAVIHVRSVEVGGAIEAALRRGVDGILHTVQAIAGVAWRDPPRLWVVTRGAQALGGPVACEQAPALGLARVIAMEHPELRCARVDLDPRAGGEDAAVLAAEVGADDREEEVAWRGGVRHAARLVRRAPEVSAGTGSLSAGTGVLSAGTGGVGMSEGTGTLSAGTGGAYPGAGSSAGGPVVRADRSYLVTGGLGGLGLAVAGWLAERGAGCVVLVGRGGVVDDGQRAAIAAIEAGGTRVIVARADVADRGQVAGVLAAVAGSGLPLAGVVHAAGVLDDGLLIHQTRARLRTVMAPKILGALHLDELTRDAEIELFVLFGSAAGLLGAPGQGNYAAANAFLDALAHRRRADGLAALCVDWGAFAEVGLAAAESRGARLASRGLGSLRPADGLAALGRLLAAGAAQAAVLPIDVRQWVEFYPAAAGSRMLAPLLADSPMGDAGAGLRASIAAARGAERTALLQKFVRAEAARVLRLAEDDLPGGAPLTGLGMDSLMGLELRNRVEAGLGLRIPATLLWTYPTVDALAGHLCELLAEPVVVPPPAAPSRPAADVADEVDEDGLLELLGATLARARGGQGR